MILRKPNDISEIDSLNTEAFPAEERISICDLVHLSRQDDYELLAAYADETFVGFTFLAVCRPSLYLFLLAVKPELRSKGYGGAMLQSIREFFPDCQVVVDIQRTDEACDNLPQRLKRRDFYLTNGFHPTGCYLQFNGMDFDVLCSSSAFDKDAFARVIEKMNLNGFLLGLRRD